MSFTLPRDVLLLLIKSSTEYRLSDHNRSPVSVSPQHIGTDLRTADGTLRRFSRAYKSTWSCSWEMLPSKDVKTMDGFMGGESIRDFFLATPGEFTLRLEDRDGTDDYTVVFDLDGCNFEIVKRWPSIDFWSVDIKLKEV